jgi:hypothetical protein
MKVDTPDGVDQRLQPYGKKCKAVLLSPPLGHTFAYQHKEKLVGNYEWNEMKKKRG